MTDPQQPQSLPPKLELWEGSSAYVNQGRHWSSAIIWLSSSLFGIALVWAFTAKIDQTISVRGRLEPSGSVREVDAPSSGVVADVLVKEGEIVQAGQPLFTVEAEGLASRRKALQTTLELLQVQAKSLKAVLDGGIEGRPENVIFYATSNRRHLMPRDMIENERSTAINPGEAVEEKVSLSDRFGLWLGFHNSDQENYLAMVSGYAEFYGLGIDAETLRSLIEASF